MIKKCTITVCLAIIKIRIKFGRQTSDLWKNAASQSDEPADSQQGRKIKEGKGQIKEDPSVQNVRDVSKHCVFQSCVIPVGQR